MPHAGPSPHAAGALAAGTAAAAAVYVASSHDTADAQQQQQQQWSGLSSVQQQATSPPWLSQLACAITQRFTAAADTPQQQQQQQHAAWTSGPGSRSSSEPLSGAIAALDEDGLTNHPLDYNPITNEHTAAMTLAKQAGLEAYQQGRYGVLTQELLSGNRYCAGKVVVMCVAFGGGGIHRHGG